MGNAALRGRREGAAALERAVAAPVSSRKYGGVRRAGTDRSRALTGDAGHGTVDLCAVECVVVVVAAALGLAPAGAARKPLVERNLLRSGRHVRCVWRAAPVCMGLGEACADAARNSSCRVVSMWLCMYGWKKETPPEEEDTPGRRILTTALHRAVVGHAGRHVGDLRAGHLVLPERRRTGENTELGGRETGTPRNVIYQVAAEHGGVSILIWPD